MTIEEIEAALATLNERMNQDAQDAPIAQALVAVQCELLLHIYKKLESIEKKLELVPPLLVHRSSRVY